MERLLGSWPYQLWDGVWPLFSEHGEGVGQGTQSCRVLGGQVGSFSSRVHGVRAACPGAHTKEGLSMCKKQPPQEPGSSGELAARPQAPRHAGQEGQARRWAGM